MRVRCRFSHMANTPHAAYCLDDLLFTILKHFLVLYRPLAVCLQESFVVWRHDFLVMMQQPFFSSRFCP